MGKPPLPDLPETGRHYLDDTLRARLANPGIVHYHLAPRSAGARVALAAVVLAAIVAAMVWLTR